MIVFLVAEMIVRQPMRYDPTRRIDSPGPVSATPAIVSDTKLVNYPRFSQIFPLPGPLPRPETFECPIVSLLYVNIHELYFLCSEDLALTWIESPNCYFFSNAHNMLSNGTILKHYILSHYEVRRQILSCLPKHVNDINNCSQYFLSSQHICFHTELFR